jgi:hypothetical protein
MGDEIPSDQEIGRKAHIADHFELIGQALHCAGWDLSAPTFFGPFPSQMGEIFSVAREARWQLKVRQQRIAEM